jgi:hypothetical protein
MKNSDVLIQRLTLDFTLPFFFNQYQSDGFFCYFLASNSIVKQMRKGIHCNTSMKRVFSVVRKMVCFHHLCWKPLLSVLNSVFFFVLYFRPKTREVSVEVGQKIILSIKQRISEKINHKSFHFIQFHQYFHLPYQQCVFLFELKNNT